MRVKLTTNLRHNTAEDPERKEFKAGDEVDLNEKFAQALLDAGSAVIPGAEGADPEVAMELAELRAELADAEAAIENQKAQNAELGAQCEKLDAELAKANEQVSELGAALTKAQKEASDLKKQLADAKKAAKADAPDESGK